MLEEGIHEAKLENLTTRAIVGGTNKNGAWNAFSASLTMYKKEAYPQSVKELEDMMTEYATELHDNHWDKP